MYQRHKQRVTSNSKHSRWPVGDLQVPFYYCITCSERKLVCVCVCMWPERTTPSLLFLARCVWLALTYLLVTRFFASVTFVTLAIYIVLCGEKRREEERRNSVYEVTSSTSTQCTWCIVHRSSCIPSFFCIKCTHCELSVRRADVVYREEGKGEESKEKGKGRKNKTSYVKRMNDLKEGEWMLPYSRTWIESECMLKVVAVSYLYIVHEHCWVEK